VDVEIDYSENVILRQLLVGMHDEELQRDLLTKENLTLPAAEKAIADMEAAKRSQEALQNKPAGVNALSQYKKDKKEKGKDDGKCGYCGQERHGEANKERKKQCKAFGKDCSKCGKADHFEKVCRSKAPPATPASSVQEDSVDAFIFKVKTGTKTAGSHNISMLSYNKKLGNWVSKEKEEKENLPVSLEVCHSSLVTLSKKYKKQEIKSNYNTHKATSLADTGATVTCGGLDILKGLGMKQEALLPTKVVLRAANGQKLTTLGTVPVKLSISSYGESTRTLVYIAKELSRLLICKDDLISLGSIPASFPFPPTEKINGIEFEKAPIDSTKKEDDLAPCGCPKRKNAPPPPKLPFEPTEENVDKLEQFLKDYYRSSTFNTCNHQPLPLIHGPPLEFQMKKDAKPVQVNVPATVPVHWLKKVREGIDADVSMGDLEWVPVNEPQTWCHRMVV